MHLLRISSGVFSALPSLTDWTRRGNIIRYNFLHDIYGPGSYGASGVYLDDQYSSALVFGNIFVRVQRAIQLGGGRDNKIFNNIFYNCTQNLYMDCRGMPGFTPHNEYTMLYNLNLVPYKTSPWSDQYPELVNILNDFPMEPRGE